MITTYNTLQKNKFPDVTYCEAAGKRSTSNGRELAVWCELLVLNPKIHYLFKQYSSVHFLRAAPLTAKKPKELGLYMREISTDMIANQLKTLLREGIQGPEKDWSYFTDPNSKGFLGTIEQLSSTAASKTSGPNDNSVAAHAWHLTFALKATSEWIQGDDSPKDWKKSWQVQQVDDSEWVKIQSELRQEYEDFLRVIETADFSNEEVTSGTIGAIAHVAYHLGAIRQKLSDNDI